MNNVIFIVGVGRSGTSLLQSMLNAHGDIAFIPETQFLRKYVFTGNRRITPASFTAFKETLRSDKNFRRANIEPELVVKEGKTNLQTYQLILEEYLRRKEKRLIGDKDPRNIDFIPELKSIFPNSKIVHIIRDPRDVVLSRTKADWSKQWPFNLHAYIYNAQINRGRKLGRKLFGKNYHELFYENLIENPTQELEKICAFIRVPYDANMLNFGSSARELVDKSELQWKSETFGPLLSTNKNKWRSAFTASQIDLIQKVCASSFEAFPYEKEEIVQNFYQNKFHKVGAKIFETLYPIRVQFLKK